MSDDHDKEAPKPTSAWGDEAPGEGATRMFSLKMESWLTDISELEAPADGTMRMTPPPAAGMPPPMGQPPAAPAPHGQPSPYDQAPYGQQAPSPYGQAATPPGQAPAPYG